MLTTAHRAREEIIEPALPIIDPHHHLWDRTPVLALMPREHAFQRVLDFAARYLLDEFLADLYSGHNIAATVFIECHAMLNAAAEPTAKHIGETEFVNGVAAMSASGLYGPTKVCAGIVGNVDLMTLGANAGVMLDKHIAAGGGRFRGIRNSGSWDADVNVMGPIGRQGAGKYLDPKFREGFAELAKRNLSFDAWMLEPQLPELVSLARAFPDTKIVLDHVGTPLGIASYTGKREERYPIWLKSIRELATCPNVHVKLGGLAMVFCNFPSCNAEPRAPSTQLATEWRPYVEPVIEAFGAKRCMFESNFPVDGVSCSYPVLWNALKRLASGASAEEKHELFFGTANRFYRLGL